MGYRRRHGGAVNVRPCGLHQILDQRRLSCHERPTGSEGFAQRANQNRHVVLGCHSSPWACALDDASTTVPDTPDAMGIVHHEPGATLSGDGDQGRQRGKVAIHAEHAVCYQQMLSGSAGIQHGLHCRGITMGIAPGLRPAQPAAVQQGRMVQRILQHQVSFLHQCVDDTDIGHVTGTEQQRPVPAQEVRQLLFKSMVCCTVTGDEMGRPAAKPILFQSLPAGRQHGRMAGEAKVVIAAEGHQGMPVEHHCGLLRAVPHQPLSQQSLLPAQSQALSKCRAKRCTGRSATHRHEPYPCARSPSFSNSARSALSCGRGVVSSFSP